MAHPLLGPSDHDLCHAPDEPAERACLTGPEPTPPSWWKSPPDDCPLRRFEVIITLHKQKP